MIKTTLELAAKANVSFLGIGELNDDAPLHEDGFIGASELKALPRSGIIGEIVCSSYDREGRIIEGMSNDPVASGARQVVGHRQGRKTPGVADAIKRRIINGLIIDELTAEVLLAE
jgi:DNA-binding transcriptional regulator LsrR (DeoR family)